MKLLVPQGDMSRDLRRKDAGFFLTIRVQRVAGVLSRIEPGALMPALTPLGELVHEKLESLVTHHAGKLRLDSFALMSDHIHVCCYQVEDMPRSPLQYLTATLRLIEREAEIRFHIPQVWDRPGELFICYSREKYAEKNAYTRGNITRAHLAREATDLGTPHPVFHPALDPNRDWVGQGDIRLLEAPHLLPIHVHRITTDADMMRFTRLAMALAQEDWLLVGAFISSRERALLRAVREAVPRVRVIEISPRRLEGGKLPARLAERLFARLLLRLSSNDETVCRREMCEWCNAWVESFCLGWRESVVAHFREKGAAREALAQTRAFLARWVGR